ncbi:hypothetical protein EDD93_4812 [Streptomyces sp. 840.1]|nr:hypothetical protein EDD93_4812 [Streptomyces sp. 840.1]
MENILTLAAAGQGRKELPPWGIAVFLVIVAMVGVFLLFRFKKRR